MGHCIPILYFTYPKNLHVIKYSFTENCLVVCHLGVPWLPFSYRPLLQALILCPRLLVVIANALKIFVTTSSIVSLNILLGNISRSRNTISDYFRALINCPSETLNQISVITSRGWAHHTKGCQGWYGQGGEHVDKGKSGRKEQTTWVDVYGAWKMVCWLKWKILLRK